MKSIHHFLTIRLLGVLIPILVVAALLLFFIVRHQLLANFDQNMATRARHFACMLEQEQEGIEIEFREAFLPEYTRQISPSYVQIWAEDGTVLERSLSLEGSDLPRHKSDIDKPLFWNLTLPDGRKGRGTTISFFPYIDTEEFTEIPDRSPVQIAMAGDLKEISGILHSLAAGFALIVFLTGGCLIVGVRKIIDRAILPLQQLAEQTSTIDPRHLDFRYATLSLPQELLPITKQLNDLLDRLNLAFLREKQLTSNVAHELKTPIAELQALAEVALKWPEDRRFVKESLKNTLAIAKQMNDLITVLLTLSRCEAGRHQVAFAPFNLADMIREAWAPWQKTASSKKINPTFDLIDKAELVSDRIMLSSILANVFSNAAEYTPVAGTISCHLSETSTSFILIVQNSNNDLAHEDLPHLFKHMWQKKSARNDLSHYGLGLSIVKSFADILGVSVNARLCDNGDLRLSIHMPK